uniref:Uncharacterized protein n=1 Tax=Cucumis melo TaxID=3656 RepID=A0A9I9DB75_CUCME
MPPSRRTSTLLIDRHRTLLHVGRTYSMLLTNRRRTLLYADCTCSTSAAPGLFSAGEDVYSCKEETDEKFQEVAARSTY